MIFSLALEALITLVERNCDVDIGDNSGSFPAHLASRMDKLDCLRFLVKQGCTFDMTQGEGKTFAHMVSWVLQQLSFFIIELCVS